MAEKDGAESLLWRVGAALISPKKALANSEHPDNAGRAPTDVALLLCLLFVGANLGRLARNAFLVFNGEAGAGLQGIAGVVASELQWPLLVLLFGFAVVAVFAGRKRNLGSDGDLACVAFIPAIVLTSVFVFAERAFAVAGETVSLVAIVLACLWFAAGLALAVQCARSRGDAEEAAT